MRVAAGVRAELVRARRVDLRQARAERRGVAAAALVDPVEHEHVVADARAPPGTRSAPGSASQRRPGRLGRVLARRDVRAGLDERRTTRRRTATR